MLGAQLGLSSGQEQPRWAGRLWGPSASPPGAGRRRLLVAWICYFYKDSMVRAQAGRYPSEEQQHVPSTHLKRRKSKHRIEIKAEFSSLWLSCKKPHLLYACLRIKKLSSADAFCRRDGGKEIGGWAIVLQLNEEHLSFRRWLPHARERNGATGPRRWRDQGNSMSRRQGTHTHTHTQPPSTLFLWSHVQARQRP